MTAPRGRSARWLPQTFRVRLTVLFAALFLAAGAALLGITYALVASLPVKVPPVTGAQAKLAFACKTGKAGPLPSSKCARALSAVGAQQAAMEQRNQTLGHLLG